MRWKMAQAGACLILVLGWSPTSAADDGVWIEDAGSGLRVYRGRLYTKSRYLKPISWDVSVLRVGTLGSAMP